ncbi:NDR1/HIN1-like protein 6 [Salvia miltiorrhiza]|uniref:NDR1/HIN1-like protein 6 n=1 Tax=Salvia miltiorrhiza TaxID=226208 RepID=UPI0025ABB700|nr:NDR1/HIN1-like protein 6 [Salvia miltiorrhiza]
MTDRVYPSTKPNSAAAAKPTAAGPLPAPPAKYNPNRHPYRPNPTSRHRQKKTPKFSCRRCCCLTCFWSVLLLTLTLLIAAIAAAAFYALYHPHRPAFSVTSVKISAFNLTTTPADDSTRLTARINVTLSAKNPNKKIQFAYDAMSIALLSRSVILSNTSYAAFNSSAGAISVIHAATPPRTQLLDADSLNLLKSDLRRPRGLPIRIVVDTAVAVKIDKLKARKFGIRVKCDGIHGAVPRGKTVIPANTAAADCQVDLRIKILKWTF